MQLTFTFVALFAASLAQSSPDLICTRDCKVDPCVVPNQLSKCNSCIQLGCCKNCPKIQPIVCPPGKVFKMITPRTCKSCGSHGCVPVPPTPSCKVCPEVAPLPCPPGQFFNQTVPRTCSTCAQYGCIPLPPSPSCKVCPEVAPLPCPPGQFFNQTVPRTCDTCAQYGCIPLPA